MGKICLSETEFATDDGLSLALYSPYEKKLGLTALMHS